MNTKNNKVLNSLLFNCAKKHWGILILISITVLITEVIGTIVNSNILSKIIDNISIGNRQISTYLNIIAVFGVFSIISIIFDVVGQYFWCRFRCKAELLDGFPNYLKIVLNHSYDFFIKNGAGEIKTDIETLSTNTASLVYPIFSIFIPYFCTLVCLSIYFIKYSAFVSIFVFFWSIFFSYFTIYLSRNVMDSFRATGKARTKISFVLNDILTNILNIKTFSRNNKEKNTLKRTTIECLRRRMEADINFRKELIARSTVDTVFNVCLLLLLIYNYLNNRISSGDFFFIFYSMKAIENNNRVFTQRLGVYISEYSEATANIKVLFDDSKLNNTTTKEIDISKGKIEFKNVTFKY